MARWWRPRRFFEPLHQVLMAPPLIDFCGSGTISSGSGTRRLPRPWQVGQAPRWELKEKCLGVSFGRREAGLRIAVGGGEGDARPSARGRSLSAALGECGEGLAFGPVQGGLDGVGDAGCGCRRGSPGGR